MENQDTYSQYNTVDYETRCLPYIDRAGELDIEGSGIFERLRSFNVYCTVGRIDDQLIFVVKIKGVIEEDKTAVRYAQYHLEAVVRNDPLLKLISHGRELEMEEDWNAVERFQLDISTCLKINKGELKRRIERRTTVLNEKKNAAGEIVQYKMKKVPNANTSFNEHTVFKR